jgi:polyisoprenoid-binding protein YceI
MAVAPGHYRLGPDNGRIVLRTFREGLGARAGHDLVIDVPRWSGELTVNDDKTLASIEATIDMTSWIVREGNGGIKPLTDRDRREITTTARRVLSTQQHPEARFAASRFAPAGDDAGTLEGTFTLNGIERPLRLQVSEVGQSRYRAKGTVVQSAYGIKPYTGFFGALKVRDAVDFEVEAEVHAQDVSRMNRREE